MCLTAGFAIVDAQAGPIPTGTATTTISYQTANGLVSVSGQRDYRGTGPTDASVLVGAENIKIFNSFNEFGRRPLVLGAVGPNESYIAHAFYKADNNAEYFPGLVEGGDIHVQFENIQFDGPVTVDESTILFHALFSADQVDQLDDFYIHVQNHHTAVAAFRELEGFFTAGVFNHLPISTVILADIDPIITGNGTDTIGIELTFPYAMLRNFEETGQTVPGFLPAPQGFLEPFHFHLEYVVVPEPGSLALLLIGMAAIVRRRR